MFGRINNKRDYSKSVNGTVIEDLYEIQIGDCYAVKEQLKELGYKWNACESAWCLPCKDNEIGNAIAEVVVKINLPMSEYQQMLISMAQTDIDVSVVSMDDAHTAMITEHYTK